MHQLFNLTNDNNDLLYISKTKIDASFKTNLHEHPNLEILLFTSGVGEIMTINQNLKVKKGSLVIVNPNSKHFESTSGLEFYALGIKRTNIYLQETFTEKIINESLSNEDFHNFDLLYSLIYQEGPRKDDSSNVLIDHLFQTIMIYLSRNNRIVKNEENESDIVYNVKNIIDNYYYLNIRLDDLASRLSESTSNLCHVFKEETGETIIEYKINKQLKEAYSLIEGSDMTVSEVSSMVGFNSSSYFTRLFKEKYGILPKEVKKHS